MKRAVLEVGEEWYPVNYIKIQDPEDVLDCDTVIEVPNKLMKKIEIFEKTYNKYFSICGKLKENGDNSKIFEEIDKLLNECAEKILKYEKVENE